MKIFLRFIFIIWSGTKIDVCQGILTLSFKLLPYHPIPQCSQSEVFTIKLLIFDSAITLKRFMNSISPEIKNTNLNIVIVGSMYYIDWIWIVDCLWHQEFITILYSLENSMWLVTLHKKYQHETSLSWK